MKLLPTLTKDAANFEIEWDGNPVKFSAKRHALTPRLMKRFSNVEKDPMEMAYALSEILDKWDITDVDCKDAEALGGLPVEFLAKLVEKIGETWAGEKKPQAISVAG
jgi:hypothetical protein